jgi:hypothetical protein
MPNLLSVPALAVLAGLLTLALAPAAHASVLSARPWTDPLLGAGATQDITFTLAADPAAPLTRFSGVVVDVAVPGGLELMSVSSTQGCEATVPGIPPPPADSSQLSCPTLIRPGQTTLVTVGVRRVTGLLPDARALVLHVGITVTSFLTYQRLGSEQREVAVVLTGTSRSSIDGLINGQLLLDGGRLHRRSLTLRASCPAETRGACRAARLRSLLVRAGDLAWRFPKTRTVAPLAAGAIRTMRVALTGHQAAALRHAHGGQLHLTLTDQTGEMPLILAIAGR